MKIVLIGAGNLATNLALGLVKQSYNISQVYSKTIESAKTLAALTNSKATNDISEIEKDAHLYIFSVKDSALEEVLNNIPPNNGLWVHTSGSIPMSVFENHNQNYGVIYPFQTFSKQRRVNFREIPVFIEANTEENFDKLCSIFLSISGKIFPLSSEKRKYVHLTGVFACNFVNHLYEISSRILEKEDIPFDIVLPLIDETAAKVHDMKPKDAQTGPAVRYDRNIIDKHLALIKDERLKEIYRLMSEDIHETNSN